MKAILYVVFFSIIPFLNNSNLYIFNPTHDIYLSSTSIEHNKTNKSLEITSSYYTDDLEKAIEKDYKVELNLGTKKEHKEADKYITKYFKENFILMIDNKPTEYTYLGKEVEIEKTYNYIEILNISSFKKINIESKMLFNVARNQENIFNIKNNGKKRSIVLYYKKSKGAIIF